MASFKSNFTVNETIGQNNQPETEMQTVVCRHLHWLIACPNNVRAKGRTMFHSLAYIKYSILAAIIGLFVWSLPFVIFAGESTIDKFTNGSRTMNIIQNNYQWYF